jgi:serine/threonine protein kinase, bacterial
VSELLTVTSIAEYPGTYVRRHGTVVAEFDYVSQESGNLSWLVDTSAGRLFVKTAGSPGRQPPGALVPYLDHDARVRLLRNAIELAACCRHPALAQLLNVIETPAGPALIYECAMGELLGVARERRTDPASAYQRFAHLSADCLLAIFDVLLDLHAALAEAGWVASDLYDGCLMVDFATLRLTVVDLDSYRRGPGINDIGRMFGSTRFMAPEEFELGAQIDERTTVFNLGRLVWHFGTRLSEQVEDFCGPPALAQVIQQACQPSRTARTSSVASFVDAWTSARH